MKAIDNFRNKSRNTPRNTPRKKLSFLLMLFTSIFLFFSLSLLSTSSFSCDCPKKESIFGDNFAWVENFYDDVLCDYSIYYGKENLLWLGGTLATAGILANTEMDKKFRHRWQHHIRGKTTNRLRPFEHIGVFNYSKVYIVLSALSAPISQRSPFSQLLYQWSYRSLRTMLLASPQITLLRKVLGGGRPGSKKVYSDSKWRIGKRSRPSCSGHTFNGAIPFLTLAFMNEKPIYRYGFMALSTLPGISRINDDSHYLSQVLIGWGIAFLSARAVAYSEELRPICPIQYEVIPLKDGAFFKASLQF